MSKNKSSSKKVNKNSNKKPKIVKITKEQLEKLTEAINNSNLDSEFSDFILNIAFGNNWLVSALEKGELTIAKLRKMIFGSTSEAANRRKKEANQKNNKGKLIDNDNEQKNTSSNNKKGHGRIGAASYTGANIVNVEIENLRPGDNCPDENCNGRLYETSEPGVLLRITGGPPISATKYELQKLRCNLCNTIYTAKPPKGISDQKYDEACVAMLMINKYFMSIPLYRQENLQKYLGVPIPSSTQWELMAEHETTLGKLYNAFLFDAAQAKGISFDDTKAVVLEQLAINKAAENKKEKKACYTTGFVSAHDDHLSYVFLTSNNVSGKDLAPILTMRDPSLPKPYLMCDALTANIPENISKDLYILCYCLVHARRQVYDLPEGYDDLADNVIRLIGKIYDNEENTKNLTEEERLKYHKKHSAPIMRELKKHLLKQKKEYEPNSVGGAAIDYFLKRWTELTQFLRYKFVPIDNNIVERALKLIIQVRKSSMFYKTLHSAKIASYIQTALYSAAQNDINPYEYMRSILCNAEKVEKEPNKWLPWKYQSTLSEVADNALHGVGNDTSSP